MDWVWSTYDIRREDGTFDFTSATLASVHDNWMNKVIDTVPASQLLVHQSIHGWEPLCAFLGVDVPDHPYPRTNTGKDYASTITYLERGTGLFLVFCLACITLSALWFSKYVLKTKSKQL